LPHFWIFCHPANKSYLKFPIGFILLFKNCPDVVQQPLNISQQPSNNLLAAPTGCPIAFKSISQQRLMKAEQFLSIFLEVTFFTFLNIKNRRHTGKFKNPQQQLSQHRPSNNLTLRQSQSRATSPLSTQKILKSAHFKLAHQNFAKVKPYSKFVYPLQQTVHIYRAFDVQMKTRYILYLNFSTRR
jgi:hypothetical protein